LRRQNDREKASRDSVIVAGVVRAAEALRDPRLRVAASVVAEGPEEPVRLAERVGSHAVIVA